MILFVSGVFADSISCNEVILDGDCTKSPYGVLYRTWRIGHTKQLQREETTVCDCSVCENIGRDWN